MNLYKNIFALLLALGLTSYANAKMNNPIICDATSTPYCYSDINTIIPVEVDICPNSGGTVSINFEQGQVENGVDQLYVCQGPPGSGTLGNEIYQGYGNAGNIEGLCFTSSVNQCLSIFINSNSSITCATENFTPIVICSAINDPNTPVVNGDCPTYSAPTSAAESCATAPYSFTIPSTNCPKVVTWTVTGNAGSQYADEFSWQITNLTTNAVVASSGNFGIGNVYADNETFTITIGPDPSATVGTSYNLEVDDTFGDGFNGNGFISILDFNGNEIIRIDGNYGASANSGFATPEYVSDVTYSVTTSAGTTTGTLVDCQNLVEEITFANPNFCTTTTENIAWDLICTVTGASVQSGNMDITVYPDVPVAAADMVTITPDATNCGWEVTVNSDCDMADYGTLFTIDPDPATTTYNPGDSGNELFTVTYTGFAAGPDCCAVGGPPINQTFVTPAPTASATVNDSPFGGTNNAALLTTGPAGSGGLSIGGNFNVTVSGYSYPPPNRPNQSDAMGDCIEAVNSPNFWTTIYVDGTLISDELTDPIAGTIATANPSGVSGTASVGGYTISISFADIQEDGVTFDENSVIEAFVYPNSFSGPSQPCGSADVVTTFDQGGAIDDTGEWGATQIEISSVYFVFQETETGPRDCTLETTEAYSCPNNLPPAADDGTLTAIQDIDTNGAATGSDPDNDMPLVFSDPVDGDGTIVSTQGGIITLNPDGTYVYNSNGFAGPTDTFEFQICDPGGLCDIGTITVTVDVNCIPDAGIPSYSCDYAVGDNPSITNTGYNTDPGTAHICYLVDDSGTIIQTDTDNTGDCDFTSVPYGNFNVYALNDCPGGASDVTANPPADEAAIVAYGAAADVDVVGPVAITVCNPSITTVNCGEDIILSSQPDYNMDNNMIYVLVCDDNIEATVTVPAGTTPSEGILTTPNPSPAASCTAYIVNHCPTGDASAIVPNASWAAVDPSADTDDFDVITVPLTVNCVLNDPPVAVDDVETTPEDTPLNATAATGDSDPNAGDVLTYTAVSGGATATTNLGIDVTIDPATGNYTYTPDADYNGTDTFEYAVCDQDGLCDSGSVIITINPVNDPPVATDDNDATNEDTPITSYVLKNDYDIDGATDPASVTVTTQPTNGTAVANLDGSVTYTPDPDFNGTDTYAYQVCDYNTPTLCDIAVVLLDIYPVDDVPVAVDDSGSGTEDMSVTITVTANDSDADGNLDPTAVTISTPPIYGTATVNPDGTIDYTPAADVNGTDTFEYIVCDITIPTPLCDDAVVTITVNPVNDPPVAINDNDATNEDTPITTSLLKNDYDIDGTIDPTSVIIVFGPDNGTLVNNFDGSIQYTPNLDYSGVDTYAYQVCDDNTPTPLCDVAVVTITVYLVNDAPVAVDDNDATNEDTPVTTSVLNNDYDNDGLIDPTSVTIVSGPDNGTLVNNFDGTITYIPDNNFNGPDTYSYQVCDDNTPTPLCDIAVVTIIVYQINDAPTAGDDNDATNEDTPITTSVLKNDFDNDGVIDPTSVTIVSGPDNGTLVNNFDGTIQYSPNSDYNGVDTYSYQVCDDNTPTPLCDIAVVTMDVNPVADAPVLIDDTETTAENTPITITVLANDSDPDGPIDPANLFTPDQPTNGTTSTNADGTITYTPDANFTGTDSFTYAVCDLPFPAGPCDIAIVYITVTPGPTLSISGQVNNCAGNNMEQVEMTLTGDANELTLTNTTGNFLLDDLDSGNYTLTPTTSNTDAGNGLSVIDLIMIQRHIQGVAEMTDPCQLIAADVNRSCGLSVVDIIQIKRIIQGDASSFPAGDAWRFIPADFVFPVGQFPCNFPESIDYSPLLQNEGNQDFIGIKIGDVNASGN